MQEVGWQGQSLGRIKAWGHIFIFLFRSLFFSLSFSLSNPGGLTGNLRYRGLQCYPSPILLSKFLGSLYCPFHLAWPKNKFALENARTQGLLRDRLDDGSTNEGGQRTPSINCLQRVTFSHVSVTVPNDLKGNFPHTVVWCLAFVVPPSFVDPSSGL